MQSFPTEGGTNPTIDPINQILSWFETAIPNPTNRNALTQIGVHFEEVCEMAQVLKDAGGSFPAQEQLKFAADVLHYFQRHLKSGEIVIDFDKVDRVALLDALCDQIVTAVGVAHMAGMDIEGALQEVADSNDSKFGEGGQPLFNEHRKIMKGPNYRSPDLARFANREKQANDEEARQ